MSERFIVQVAPKMYFLSFGVRRKPTPIGVRAMSIAQRFSYPDADHLCVFLREEGYPCASVCDIYGDLITHDTLERSEKSDKKYLRYPRNRKEYRGLRRFVANDLLDLWKSRDIVFEAAVRKFERRPKIAAPKTERKRVSRTN